MSMCPNCSGAKKHIYSTSKIRNGVKVFGVMEVPCALCKGNGYISARDEKRYNASLLTSEQ